MKGHEAQFWNTFRQIAENPVGRVLLYRLLIEIRRQNNGNGAQEAGIDVVNLDDRNGARTLMIKYNIEDGGGIYSWEYQDAEGGQNAEISCNFEALRVDDTEAIVTCSGSVQLEPPSGSCYTTTRPYYVTGTLFHEMMPWYQQLRDQERTTVEWGVEVNKLSETSLVCLFGYKKESSFNSWRTDTINVCDFRVICGGYSKDPTYHNGDDLSENVFRASKKQCMAFGHDNEISKEKSEEVDPIIRRVYDQLQKCLQTIIPTFVWNFVVGQAVYGVE
jgi:hypothetical protein